MNRKNCVLLALAAGSACALPVLAQQRGITKMEKADGTLVDQPTIFKMNRAFSRAESYDARDVLVLDNLTGAFTNATRQLLGCNHLVDDYSFTPGPWSASATRIGTSWSWTLFIGRWDGTTSPAANIGFRAFNVGAFDSTIGASMIPASATLAADITYGFPAGFFNDDQPDVGYVINFIFPDNPLDITAGAEDMIFSGGGMLLEVGIQDPANPAKFAWYPSIPLSNPLGNAAAYIPAGENSVAPVQLYGLMMMNKPTSPGSAPSINYGRDINGDNIFQASTPIAGGGATSPTDIRDTRTNAGRSYGVSIKGNVVPVPPAADLDLGCLADGSVNGTITGRAPGAFKTIKFCLKGDATDAQRRFLDIIGDTTDGTDFSVGVYSEATGAVVSVLGSDDNSGDSVTGAPQLSFGVGRRAKPVSTAQPLDGRNGQLTAGTYYALVSGPAAGFGDGYIVNVPDVSLDAGGDNTLSFSTNVNGGALAASVAPDAADYGGSVITIPPSFDGGAGVQASPLAVTWYSFSLCEDVGAPGSTEFLDIDLGSTSVSAPTTQVLLFDSAGNLVGNNTTTGTANSSQLSYSDAALAARVGQRAGSDPLAGQNGSLAAGTYYVAAGLSTINTLVAGDRWHVRPNSGSSFPIPVDVNTNIDCVAGCPCSADYDLSGGTPDAGDIDAFFSDWLLGEARADADCSGGTPDAGDIDTFFAQWLNGGC
jgi:hypothetical protein